MIAKTGSTICSDWQKEKARVGPAVRKITVKSLQSSVVLDRRRCSTAKSKFAYFVIGLRNWSLAQTTFGSSMWSAVRSLSSLRRYFALQKGCSQAFARVVDLHFG